MTSGKVVIREADLERLIGIIEGVAGCVDNKNVEGILGTVVESLDELITLGRVGAE